MQYLFNEGINAVVPDNQFGKRNPVFSDSDFYKKHKALRKKMRKDQHGRDKAFHSSVFSVNLDSNSCICPAGKETLFLGDDFDGARGVYSRFLQGRLRISSPESLAMSLLPEVLLRFQQQFPKIELDIQVSGRLVSLVEEGIDVALRVGKQEDSSLIERLLMPCGLHACASPEYLEKHGKPEHPSELETHSCLIYSQTPNPDTWLFRDDQR